MADNIQAGTPSLQMREQKTTRQLYGLHQRQAAAPLVPHGEIRLWAQEGEWLPNTACGPSCRLVPWALGETVSCRDGWDSAPSPVRVGRGAWRKHSASCTAAVPAVGRSGRPGTSRTGANSGRRSQTAHDLCAKSGLSDPIRSTVSRQTPQMGRQ